MRYGFSTGALAKGDFEHALSMLAPFRLPAIEISALRSSELGRVVERLASLDLRGYAHVTLHAPSRFAPDEETSVIERLTQVAERVEGIVVHAEAIVDARQWRALGAKVLAENADLRKRTGRTTSEMLTVLAELPEARVCLDLAHVHQIDFSLHEARRMLLAFGERIAQVHLSQLDHACRHEALTYGVVRRFQGLASLVPDVPVILESCVAAAHIGSQIELARACFEEQLVADFAAAE